MCGATFHPWVFKMRIVKVLIRLCKCAGWSDSLLCAYVRRYVLWHAVWSEPSLGAFLRAKDVKVSTRGQQQLSILRGCGTYFSVLLARMSEGTCSHAAANYLDWFLPCKCPIYWGLAPTCYALCATYLQSNFKVSNTDSSFTVPTSFLSP